MSEASELLDQASIKLDEAIIALQEVQEQLRLAKMNIWMVRQRFGMEVEIHEEQELVVMVETY